MKLKNEFSQKIFEFIPNNMDVGDTDIISLKNKILMMIRDRGHATTMEIDLQNQDVWVNYFITKICKIQNLI